MSPIYHSPSPTHNRRSSPKMSTSLLISLSHQKLTHLSSLLSSSPRDSPDLLRKGVLIQNAMDWGVGERKREKERELEIRSGMRRSVGYHKSQVWASPAAATTTVEAVIEEEEEEEEEATAVVSPETRTISQIEQIIAGAGSEAAIETESENGMVVDPSEYLFAHAEAEEEQEQEEEAWFEEHWRDLQAETPAHVHSQAVTTPAPFSAATTDVSVQIYSVDSSSESEESDPSNSPTPSATTTTTTTAMPTATVTAMAMEISPPPSPKLSPTRLQDKLESPMEFGTMPARLESAMSYEEFESVWEVRGLGEMFVMPEPEPAMAVAVYEEDIPALEDGMEEDESDIDDDEEKDDELLITPGEEALDEFGAASFGSEIGEGMAEMRLIGVKGKA